MTTRRPLRVLIVEDECFTGWGLQGVLDDEGCEVLPVAESADQAVVMAEQLRPDLVLMDVGLRGEESGLGAAERIQRRTPTRIVFTTARRDAATLEAIARLRPFGAVIKPFADGEVVALVRRARAEIESPAIV